MANSDKNILITPNTSAATGTLPTIKFTGADNTPITMRVLDNGTLSYEATAGQLFSISDGLTGSIFSVNDISGIPSIEVLDTGTVRLAQYTGNVGIGIASPATKLDVLGGSILVRNAATQDGVSLAGRAGGTSSWEVTLTPTTLTADRTVTLPDSSGTLAFTNQTFFIGTQSIAINQGTGTITALPGVSSINGATVPSSGTLATTTQSFFIGTQSVSISQGSGTITALPGVTSVNGTTIPSTATLLTSTSTSSVLTSFGSGATLNNGVLTGTLTANASVGSAGQYLESTGTGVRWTSVSGYSAPTIGSTSIPSGGTVTTIAGLTLTSPTLNTPTLTLSTSSSTTDARISWDTTNKKIQVGNGTAAVDFAPSTLTTNTATITTNNYTLVLADKDKMVELDNGATAGTVTVPASSSVAFPTGSQINIIQTGTGQFTVTPATITTATYSSGGAAGATTFVISATNASIAVGQKVTGTGFADNTFVTNVSTTTITVSPAISSQVSGTITFSVGVMGTPGLKLRTRWSSATLIKRSATDAWVLVGDITT